MAMGPSWIMMMLLAPGRRGNELLDYIPSGEFWKAKSVTISSETMMAELKDAKGGGYFGARGGVGFGRPGGARIRQREDRGDGTGGAAGVGEATHKPLAEVATRAKVLIGGSRPRRRRHPSGD